MNILDLPADVTLYIFSFLSPIELAGAVRQTCTIWHSLSYDNSLWKEIDFKKYELHHKFSSSTFREFLRGISDSVQRLDLRYTNLDDEAYYHEDIYCRNLQELYLFGCDITGECVIRLLKKYPRLKAVSLTLKSTRTFSDILKQLHNLDCLRLEVYNTGIEEYSVDMLEEFGALFRIRKNMESLSFAHCDFPSSLYNEILANSSDLRELNIQFCGQIRRDMFEISPMQTLNQLHKLKLTDTKFDDNVLTAFSDRAPNLSFVSIGGCGSFVTDTGISYLAEHSICLTTLIISRSRYDDSSITNVGLEVVAEFCHKLRHLEVNYCSEVSDRGVMAIARGCPEIEEFQVAGCTALSDTAVQCLVENCPKLRTLNLKECVQLTSLSVNAAITNLKHLRYLNLETCHRITDLNLQKTVQSCVKENRTVRQDVATLLVSSSNDRTDNTDDGVTSMNGDIGTCTLTEKMPDENDNRKLDDTIRINLDDHSHLFSLYLAFCSKISVKCIRQIASYCLDLREITLQGCSYLSDSCIGTLLKCCKFLRKLNISGGSVNQTSRLTDKCLRLISEHGENLMRLGIGKNHNITVNGLFLVITGCPKIRQVSATAGERTNITVSGLKTVAAGLETKLIRIEKFGETRVDIFVYANKGCQNEKSWRV